MPREASLLHSATTEAPNPGHDGSWPRSLVGENCLCPSFVQVEVRVGTTMAIRKDYT